MTTTEQLQLIKKECERLLALSEKRTQGEWCVDSDGKVIAVSQNEITFGNKNQFLRSFIVTQPHLYTDNENPDKTAAYIAACAGRAEAGWKSAIAAIDLIDLLNQAFMESVTIDTTNNIIAAWPIELLTNA